MGQIENRIIIRDIIVLIIFVVDGIAEIINYQTCPLFIRVVILCIALYNTVASLRLMKQEKANEERSFKAIEYLIIHILLSFSCFVSWLRYAI